MEIKTNRPREAQGTRIVPPPDTARRPKKTPQKIGKNHVAGRRFASFFRTLGKVSAVLLIVTFTVSAVVYVYNSEKFNLRKVTFYGCRELDQKELEEVIRRSFPRNILCIDLGRLKKRIEKETWAKRVEIRRVLPAGNASLQETDAHLGPRVAQLYQVLHGSGGRQQPQFYSLASKNLAIAFADLVVGASLRAGGDHDGTRWHRVQYGNNRP